MEVVVGVVVYKVEMVKDSTNLPNLPTRQRMRPKPWQQVPEKEEKS